MEIPPGVLQDIGPLGPLPKKGNFEPEKAVLGPDRADSGSVRARLGLERPKGEWQIDRRTDGWTDVWKLTHVSYSILALWSCCPEMPTKH